MWREQQALYRQTDRQTSVHLWQCLAECFVMRIISDKEYIKTKHILYSIIFCQNLCLLWENVKKKYCTVVRATDDNIIRRMLFARWIIKATDTHSECVIFIVFLRQRWLRECPSILRCTDFACLVKQQCGHIGMSCEQDL